LGVRRLTSQRPTVGHAHQYARNAGEERGKGKPQQAEKGKSIVPFKESEQRFEVKKKRETI